MSDTATAPLATATSTPADGRRFWLSRRRRKTVLVVHIVAAGVWIGVDVIVAVLVLAGWFSADSTVRGIAYQALALFVVWPMLTAGLVSLVSGLILGLGSPWGLLRYWWVAVKLGLNLVLCTLIVVILQPGMGEVADHGRRLQAGATLDQDVSMLFFPPAVSLTTLSLATVLAVFKPWGRIRDYPRQRGGSEHVRPGEHDEGAVARGAARTARAGERVDPAP